LETGKFFSGLEKAASGAWQAAQAWPGGVERLFSKNNNLPRCSFVLKVESTEMVSVRPSFPVEQSPCEFLEIPRMHIVKKVIMINKRK
jgi:hypothetical protein